MASYDGMILREREYILSRANKRGSEEELEAADAAGLPYDEGSEQGDGNSGEGAPPPSGPEGETGEESAGGGQGSQNQSSGGGNRPPGEQTRAGDYSHSGGYAPPADIPDGSDDDVVARQIREAAMKEPDPELREKLWEEYRKYKNQSRQ